MSHARLMSFEEVAEALGCELDAVRRLVVEDRSLPAVIVSIDGEKLGPYGSRRLESIEADGSALILHTVPRRLDRGCRGHLRIERDAMECFRSASAVEPQRPTGGSWPWGHYETALLGKLAEAAQHWWKNFDPSDNTTAPTNQQVSEWLQQRGVSQGVADKMATILRADGLPTGPRS